MVKVDETHNTKRMMEDSVSELHSGMTQALKSLDNKTPMLAPQNEKSYFSWSQHNLQSHAGLNSNFPRSVINSRENLDTQTNVFIGPRVSLKSDSDFMEDDSWDLRSGVNQKDFVNAPPLFTFVFSDWISIEGKTQEELTILKNYGKNQNSFFGINRAAKLRNDLFYLVINVRIVNQRQSVAIFVCKKEEWQKFLLENFCTIERFNQCDKEKDNLLNALKSCLKVKAKFWTMPTYSCFKNPFVFNNILDNGSYDMQLLNDRLEVFIDQNGVNLPWLIKPLWQIVVRLTSGIGCRMQSFDLAYFLEAGKGDKHNFLFNYPEKLLGVVRASHIEWNSARVI